MSQGSNQQAQSFDFIAEGVGYLNRIRTVTPKKAPVYQACTVNVMMGAGDSVEYQSVDCIIVGKVALQVVNMLKADVEKKSKVIVGVRVSDLKPDFYEFPDRETGEMVQREGLKGRLLQITFAKVDGVKIDIPLVERPAQGQQRPATEPLDGGVGTACADTTRIPAEV